MHFLSFSLVLAKRPNVKFSFFLNFYNKGHFKEWFTQQIIYCNFFFGGGGVNIQKYKTKANINNKKT